MSTPTGAYPRTCILTGAEGENPEDCTTHDHEEDTVAEPTKPLACSIEDGACTDCYRGH